MFSERCLKVVFVSTCVLSAACTCTSSVQPLAVPSLVPVLAHTGGVFIGKEGWQSSTAYWLQHWIKVPPTAVQVSEEPGIPA